MDLNVSITLAFADSTTRTITFKGVSAEEAEGVRAKIKALNANLPESFANTFISKIGAKCTMISKAQIIWEEEEVIYNVG